MQATPLVVKGVMYLAVGTRRSVVAIHPETGETLWMYRLDEGPRGDGAIRGGTGHGVVYRTDGKEDRIVYVTPGHQLVALNARTGVPVPTFGRNGLVDLKTEADQVLDPVTGELGLHSTPLVVNDVIVVGAAHRPSGGPTTRKNNAKGYVRGYDARTGKRLWIFHTIPQPGEFGNETWLNDSWSWAGNTGVWAQMSADPELNLVYMGVELPTGDYYGGNRPGDHLFGESLIALDVKTGVRQVALSARASRSMGSRHSLRADPGRPQREWKANQGDCPADKAVVGLHVRPGHRRSLCGPSRSVLSKGSVPGKWYPLPSHL